MKGSKRERLNRSQAFRVYDWLKANVQLLQGKTDAAIAEVASNNLGFTVKACSISDIRLDGNVTWECSKPRKKVGNAVKESGLFPDAALSLESIMSFGTHFEGLMKSHPLKQKELSPLRPTLKQISSTGEWECRLGDLSERAENRTVAYARWASLIYNKAKHLSHYMSEGIPIKQGDIVADAFFYMAELTVGGIILRKIEIADFDQIMRNIPSFPKLEIVG